jgi:arabinofuranosyltransferase
MSGPSADRPVLAPWLAVATTLAIGSTSFAYTVDDAYVLGRYARRLAAGLGWTFERGPPTDGVTGPLALVPGVVGALLGLDPVLVLKSVGLASGAIAAAMVARVASRHALGGPSAWLVGGLASCGATLGIWSAAGLETGLATLAATVAALAAIARPRPRGLALGVAIAALAWLRPETAVLAAALIATAAARDRGQGALALAIGAAGAISIVVFRLSMFGSALPLAWEAKPGESLIGLGYVARGVVIVTGIAGLALAWLGARRSRSLRALVLAMLAHLVAVALAGGDWMPGFRLLAPVIPSFALVAGIGGARSIALARGRRRAIVAGLVAIALGVPAVDAVVQIPRAREAASLRERVARPLAHELRELAGDGRVALVDVGFLAYVGDLRTVDLGGITDPTIGRRHGAHLAKPIEPELLADRDVRVLVLRSFVEPVVGPEGDLVALAGEPVERSLAGSAAVRDRYRVHRVVTYSDAYFYVVLVARAHGAP